MQTEDLRGDWILSVDEIRRRSRAERPLFGSDAEESGALYQRSLQRCGAFLSQDLPLSAFVMFIGYPRSGHSLIGALLDAHPEMIVAHEFDVLDYVAKGFSRAQILYLLYENSRHFALVGRDWGKYSYAVAGQWQGRFTRLRVIGDKKGGGTSLRFAARPDDVRRFGEFIGLPMRFIHVVRNPFDMVASMVARWPPDRPAAAAPRTVRRACAINQLITATRGADEVLTVWHESFVVDPAGTIACICAFLGVDAPRDYLDACRAIVLPAPRRTGATFAWTPALRAAVEGIIAEFPFMQPYRADGVRSPN